MDYSETPEQPEEAPQEDMSSEFTTSGGPPPEEPKEEKSKTWLYVLIGVVFVLLLALIGFAIFGGTSTPEATPPPPPEAGDDSWAKIEAAGVMRVGTAADYRPFEYYNEGLVIDGFDIALIQEVGKVLGVNTEITDFAFQGLGGALQIGQVDVLISGLSITDEREAIADFSNVYYVGEDGVLAREGSDIDSVSSPADFSGKRVGVQDQTVYQDWAQSTLVATGIISQDQLYVYAKPEHAVNDLALDRLDLVVMDFLPAQKSAADPGVNLVGKSLNLQRFAIAVPQGAGALRDQLNSALTQLQNNGTMAQLYERYLNLSPDEIPTPAPPEATETPGPTATPAACINGMEFVRDLSYDDQDFIDLPQLQPGEKFAKGWRIKNSGTCTWTEDYYLGFVRGDRMGGEDTDVDSEVTSGQTYDMYVDLVAPNTGGEYAGWWQMFTDEDVPFGETIWVAIQVVGPTEVPTNTPAATATQPVPPTNTPAATATVEPSATPHPADDLIGVIWVLKEYTPPDGTPVTPPEEPESTVEFREDDTLNAFGGCNTYGGTFTSDGKEIVIEIDSGTQIACEPPVMAQEQMFLQLLEEVEDFEVKENGDKMEITAKRMINDIEEEVIIMAFHAE